jgi:adenylate kinase family enzyme
MAILLMGGPGSGKTTLSRTFLEDGLVRIDPDAVREQLPEYASLMHQHIPDLADRTREKVNLITDNKMDAAVSEKFSFVFDASGRDRDWYLGLIRRLDDAGFETTVVMAWCNRKVARHRCDERARINGRVVSSQYFRQVHAVVPANFIHYMQAANRFVLVKNDEENPLWLWYRNTSGDEMPHPEPVQAFLEQWGDGQGSLPDSFTPAPSLCKSDAWFNHIRQRMESGPCWDLRLETSIRPED